MNLKKIHHVAIIVSDYKESREFYVEKLGFRVIRENYRPEREDYKLDLELDGCELEIFSGKGNPPRVIEELHEKGIETEPIREDPFTEKRMTFFHDPDGLPLELHE